MHEYPITQHIIEMAEKYAKENDAIAVEAINLVVGDYSGYVADSINLYFEIIAEGTLCEKAVLSIERVKPKLKCTLCGEYFDRQPFSFACPNCKGEGEPTEIGKEFFLKSIEIRRE